MRGAGCPKRSSRCCLSNARLIPMESLNSLLWHNGKLFGIEWSVWKVVGMIGNLIFFSRFFVQWYATEKLKRVVVPVAFWWLSLIGSLVLLTYGLFKVKDSVVILAYAFTWIPYIRNLVIHQRHLKAHLDCPACGEICAPRSNFCHACGAKLNQQATSKTGKDDRNKTPPLRDVVPK
jgi:lipid-A-disaccharide synthase-like uncharacterized protein